MEHGNKTIRYNLYDRTEGSRKFVQDTTSVKRPDLEFLSDTIKGAGIMGEIEMPSLGQIGSLSHEINLRRENVDANALLAPKVHTLELTWATDVLNSGTGQLEKCYNKEIIKCMTKKLSEGSVEENANEDVALTTEDIYYKRIQDGKTLFEIDKLNNILIIDGVDYMKEIRDNL